MASKESGEPTQPPKKWAKTIAEKLAETGTR